MAVTEQPCIEEVRGDPSRLELEGSELKNVPAHSELNELLLEGKQTVFVLSVCGVDGDM